VVSVFNPGTNGVTFTSPLTGVVTVPPRGSQHLYFGNRNWLNPSPAPGPLPAARRLRRRSSGSPRTSWPSNHRRPWRSWPCTATATSESIPQARPWSKRRPAALLVPESAPNRARLHAATKKTPDARLLASGLCVSANGAPHASLGQRPRINHR
jgi:hypothetical protein